MKPSNKFTPIMRDAVVRFPRQLTRALIIFSAFVLFVSSSSDSCYAGYVYPFRIISGNTMNPASGSTGTPMSGR